MDVDGEKETGEEAPPAANGSATPPAADGAPSPTPAAPTENGATPAEAETKAETKAEEAPKKKVYSKVRGGAGGVGLDCVVRFRIVVVLLGHVRRGKEERGVAGEMCFFVMFVLAFSQAKLLNM